nr:hypothetical protein [Actinomycetota bacterium]
MGFIANWKAKRKFKSDNQQYAITHQDWQTDIEIFKKIKEAFELAAKG